eukprot:3761199-Prymnesium_polylepis.2
MRRRYSVSASAPAKPCPPLCGRWPGRSRWARVQTNRRPDSSRLAHAEWYSAARPPLRSKRRPRGTSSVGNPLRSSRRHTVRPLDRYRRAVR